MQHHEKYTSGFLLLPGSFKYATQPHKGLTLDDELYYMSTQGCLDCK